MSRSRDLENSFRLSENWALWLILIVAAVIRFYSGYELSLSNDELSALTRAEVSSVHDLIVNGIYIDYHPAGVELFIYFWIKLFGHSAFLFRLPFILFGIGSVYLIYLLGKKWFSPFTGLLAAALFSVSEFSILYSVFARLYSPGLFFSLLTTLYWTDILFAKESEKKIRLKKWIGFILSMSICTHIHYFSFVFVAVLGVSGLFFLVRKNRIPYLLSGLLVLILFLPELPIFIRQMKTGDIGGWLAAPEKSFLLDFVFNLFNKSLIFSSIVFLLFLPGFIRTIVQKKWNKFYTLSLTLVGITFLIAYGYSVLRAPVIQFSTLFFVLPFLLFFISECIERIVPIKWMNACLLLTILGGFSSTVLEGKIYSRPSFGLFKEPAKDIKLWIERYGKDQVACVVSSINPKYMDYYFRELQVEPWIVARHPNQPENFGILANILDTLSSQFVAFSWSNCDNIYEINKLILEKYPVLVEKRIYFNSASYLFAKSGNGISSPVMYKSCFGFEPDQIGIEQSAKIDTPAYAGKFSSLIDSSMEFPLPFRIRVKDLSETEYGWLSCHFRLLSADSNLHALIVIQIDREKETFRYFSQDLFAFNIIPGKWNTAVFSRLLPFDLQPEDEIKIYIWNKEKNNFLIDDYCISADHGDNPYTEK